jgi:hypothetical protein
MIGFLILLLAIALPFCIVVFAVKATESEHKKYIHLPISRKISACAFGFASLFGIIWIFRGMGPEYSFGMAILAGMPAAFMSASFAILAHRALVGRSKFIAIATGATIELLTIFGTILFFAAFSSSNKQSSIFIATYGTAFLLLTKGAPILLIGACTGALLSKLSNRLEIIYTSSAKSV